MHLGELDVLPELFTNNCVIHGGTVILDEDIVGLISLRDWVIEFRTAYPDLMFYIEDMGIDGDYLYSRWKARGTNVATLWNQKIPTGKEMIISGYTINFMHYGNQKIGEQWNFYSLSTLASFN